MSYLRQMERIQGSIGDLHSTLFSGFTHRLSSATSVVGFRLGQVVLGLTIYLLCLEASSTNAAETVTDIISKSEALMRGKTQAGTYQMQIISPDWQRSLKMNFWLEGGDKSFIRILEPKKERNVAFLKLGNEMWQYIPKVKRTIKIPPSMMLQSWMGSDFTNDDLVKESSNAEDYEHKLLGQSEIDGQTTYQIELTPKPSAPVVWGRIVQWIRGGDYIPVKAEFYNSRGELGRSIIYSTIKQMDDRQIPTKIEIVTTKKPDNKTVLLIESIAFDQPIPKSTFTQRNLRRSR